MAAADDDYSDLYTCEKCGKYDLVQVGFYTIKNDPKSFCLLCFVETVNTMIPCLVDRKIEKLFLVVREIATSNYRSFPITEKDLYDFPLSSLEHYDRPIIVYYNDEYTYDIDVCGILDDTNSFSAKTLADILHWTPYIDCQTGMCRVFDYDQIKIFYDSPLMPLADPNRSWATFNLQRRLFFAYRQLMYRIYETSSEAKLDTCNWKNFAPYISQSTLHTRSQNQWHAVSDMLYTVFPSPLLTIVCDYTNFADVDKLLDDRELLKSQIKNLKHKLASVKTHYDRVVNGGSRKKNKWEILMNME
jgi:hypothetical protein